MLQAAYGNRNINLIDMWAILPSNSVPQVPVQLPLISAISKIRISVPPDLRPLEARQSILLSLQELRSRFPQGLPKLNPVKVI